MTDRERPEASVAKASTALPASLLRAIIDRFRATPELVAAVPGSLLLGVPPDPTPITPTEGRHDLP